MAQRIIVDCDVHQARDEQVEGRPYDIVVRRGGDAFMFLTVDLCEACAKPLADLWVEFAEAGRPFDDTAAAALGGVVGSPNKRRRTASSAVNKSATSSSSPAHKAGEHACPACDYVGPTKDALNTHARAAHGKSLGALRGDPEPYACPDCDRRFTTPQGLGAHRSHQHGYSSPERDEAHADG